MNTTTLNDGKNHRCTKITAGLAAYAITLGFYFFASGVGTAEMHVEQAGEIMAAATNANGEVDTTEAATWAESLYVFVARIGIASQNATNHNNKKQTNQQTLGG